jgi:hypothetical protein
MRSASIVIVLLVLTTRCTSQAKLLPSGGCSVSPSGLEACSWLGPRNPRILVNHYALAAQAPLVIEASDDAIIVAADEGKLLDETRNPHERIDVFKGSSLLVPKGKRTVLRNVGDKGLLVVEIFIH